MQQSKSVWIAPGQEPRSLRNPTRASRYVKWFQKPKHQHPRVVVYIRISSRYRWKHKAAFLLEGFKRLLAAKGIEVVAQYVEQCSGQTKNLEKRTALQEAAKKAVDENVPLIAPTASRYLRSDSFNTITNPNAKPSVDEWERFVLSFVEKVRTTTWLHPNAGNDEEDAFLSTLSKSASGKHGGRPPKKTLRWYEDKRNEHLDEIFRLRYEGISLGQISKITGVKKPTIQKWLVRYKDENNRLPASPQELSSLSQPEKTKGLAEQFQCRQVSSP